MTALYTWRDVERVLRHVDAPPWARADADLESLVVQCAAERRADARVRLAECFGHGLKDDHLLLESPVGTSWLGASRRLRLVWEEPEDDDRQPLRPPVRPLWPYASEEPAELPPLEPGLSLDLAA